MRLCIAGVLLLFCSAPASAKKLPTQAVAAQKQLQRGLELYQQQRYPEAIAALLAGQAISPAPNFLYALGQAERHSGHFAKAVEYYEAFLATGPSAKQVALTQANLALCRARLPAAETPPAVKVAEPAPVKVAEPAPVKVAEPVAPLLPVAVALPVAPLPVPAALSPAVDLTVRRPRWYRDGAGAVLLGSSLAAAIMGAVLVGVAESKIGDQQTSYEHFLDAHSSNTQASLAVGATALTVSGVLLIASAARYYWKARRAH